MKTQYTNPEDRKEAKRVTRHPVYQAKADYARQVTAERDEAHRKVHNLTTYNSVLHEKVEQLMQEVAAASLQIKTFEDYIKTCESSDSEATKFNSFVEYVESLAADEKDDEAEASVEASS